MTKRAELMFDDRSMKILDLVPMGTVCLAFVPKVVPKITVCFDVVPLVVTTGTSTKVTVCLAPYTPSPSALHNPWYTSDTIHCRNVSS